MNNENNIITSSDGYKYTHHEFYADKTSEIWSYLESRGSNLQGCNYTQFFGLQAMLQEDFTGQVVTKEKIEEAEFIANNSISKNTFDKKMWNYILDKHEGRLPLLIRAVPEGLCVPTKNILLSIENTDKNINIPIAPLVQFVESRLLNIWYPITVATISNFCKSIIKESYDRTSDNEFNLFSLNDFGVRGASTANAAQIGGSAHLINFLGTDNIPAIKYLKTFYNRNSFYNEDGSLTSFGYSANATEHSIMTQRGESGEPEIIKQALNKFPEGILAFVIDSFNFIRFIEQYICKDFKEIIQNRKGTVVVRPDSGHPIQTLYKIFDLLFEGYGYTVNSKGFKVLPSCIRVLQGDSVNVNSIREILLALEKRGISSENIIFGMGGKLLQAEIDRDTFKFAIKTSYTVIDGKPIDIIKNPIELNHLGEIVPSFKKSKQGKLKLIIDENGLFKTVPQTQDNSDDILQDVFRNGELVRYQTLEDIRKISYAK